MLHTTGASDRNEAILLRILLVPATKCLVPPKDPPKRYRGRLVYEDLGYSNQHACLHCECICDTGGHDSHNLLQCRLLLRLES